MMSNTHSNESLCPFIISLFDFSMEAKKQNSAATPEDRKLRPRD
jgi:hypothetical protein